jgi:hypothetical protein
LCEVGNEGAAFDEEKAIVKEAAEKYLNNPTDECDECV